MNKIDILATVIVIVLAIISIFYVRELANTSKNTIAEVYYRNELVHTFDLSDHTQSFFEIEATNGLVRIESQDGKVRVINETSRRNICSIQGWTDSVVAPIVCLPNELFIKIVGNQNNEEVDGIIS